MDNKCVRSYALSRFRPLTNRVCREYGPVTVSFARDEAKRIGDQIGIDWHRVDVEQFRMGLGVELEHGCVSPETNVTCDDVGLTARIALAHLREDKAYYTKLKGAGL